MFLPIIFIFCTIGFGSSATLENSNRLKVTLFSESYCPYCIRYTKEQLLPAFKKFSTKIMIDLVPFGNAKQWYEDGLWKFQCQHGEKECYGNKLQACAVLETCGDKGSTHCGANKMKKVLKYIKCVEAKPDQAAASNQCATDAGLSPGGISDCAGGDKGEHLLNLYGNRTAAFKPPIAYVPTVAINNVQNEEAENDLQAAICKLRPDWCKPSIEVIMVDS